MHTSVITNKMPVPPKKDDQPGETHAVGIFKAEKFVLIFSSDTPGDTLFVSDLNISLHVTHLIGGDGGGWANGNGFLESTFSPRELCGRDHLHRLGNLLDRLNGLLPHIN